MESLPVSLIILTYNEEINIEKCLESAGNYFHDIFVVDSFSTDSTLEIVGKYKNIQIYQNSFETHSKQWIWALENLPIKTDWVFGLDADQTVTDELGLELTELFKNNLEDFDGLYVKRKYIFMHSAQILKGPLFLWITE